MPTHSELRIGMLVLWHGDEMRDEDIDDIGIVVGLPGEDWQGCYSIAWATEGEVSEHSPDRLEESIYQRQLEVIG